MLMYQDKRLSCSFTCNMRIFESYGHSFLSCFVAVGITIWTFEKHTLTSKVVFVLSLCLF